METYNIRHSRGTKLFFLVGSAVFLILTIINLVDFTMSSDSDALGSVLFFGVTLAILMVVLFDNKTHLSIDEEGIRSSNIGMVLFPWGEIDQVKLRSFLWIKFIQIDLTNPKEFKKKIPFSLKFMLLSSKVSFLPEFMLSVGGLEHRPNKILSIIEERLRLLGKTT